MSKAINMAFFVDGLHHAGYQECLNVMSKHQGQGCVEMIWAMEQYADYVDALHTKIAQITDMGDGFAGVFEYEVSSPFGEWYGKHIIEKLGPPSRDDAHKQILDLSIKFLTQEDKSKKLVQFVTTALHQASSEFFAEKEYVKNGSGKCPACGSDDVVRWEATVNGTTMRQEVCCGECDANWTDVYKLSGFDNFENLL